MILRRPYAFLVKHFRAIHAILLLGAVFLVLKTRHIVSFLSTYIKSGVSSEEALNAASNYTSFTVILVSLSLAIISGIIIYLLKYKNKSIKMYLFTLIYYLLLTGLLIWLSSFLANLGYSNSGIRFISILRDIIRFSIILNGVVIVLCFIRAIGLDLKRFDFKRDLLDLGVDTKDNEEYEFELKIDKDKIKSKINKGFRYTKYFYKENKFMFIVLGCLLIFLIAFPFLKMIISYEKVYRENQYFETNNLKVRVLKSYKTDTNNFGNEIDSRNFYVITKVEIKNKQGYEYTVGDNDIRLSFGDYELITPSKKANSKFKEFGVNYFSQIIKPYETRIFNFIYEVPNEFYYDDFTLRFLQGISFENDELKHTYKKVRLSPYTFKNKEETVSVKKLGEKMTFDESMLGKTSIIIEDIDLNDSFGYNIIKCNKDGCINRKRFVNATIAENFDLTLMRIKYKLEYDYDVLDKKYNNDTFITSFGSIRFEVNGKEYNNRLELSDVTPFYTGDYSIIQVRDKLKKADKIYLDFYIRDKKYTYIIKDNIKEEDK